MGSQRAIRTTDGVEGRVPDGYPGGLPRSGREDGSRSGDPPPRGVGVVLDGVGLRVHVRPAGPTRGVVEELSVLPVIRPLRTLCFVLRPPSLRVPPPHRPCARISSTGPSYLVPGGVSEGLLPSFDTCGFPPPARTGLQPGPTSFGPEAPPRPGQLSFANPKRVRDLRCPTRPVALFGDPCLPVSPSPGSVRVRPRTSHCGGIRRHRFVTFRCRARPTS